MGCLRCVHEWAGFPVAEPMWWLDNATVKPQFTSVSTPEELLKASDCAVYADLAMRIEDAVEPDDVELWSDVGGLSNTIDGAGAGAGLPWPFTLGEFWNLVHELEGRAMCNQACRRLESEIEHTEGFRLTIWPDAYPDGSCWPAVGRPEIPKYFYSRRAPGSWTCRQWFERRLAKVLALTELEVEVYAADDEDETLDSLRASTTAATHAQDRVT